MLWLLGLLATGAVPVDDPILGRVVDVEVRASDVTRRLGAAPDGGAFDDALRAALGDAALAVEARAILGEPAAGLSPAEAARRLRAHLFDPGERCGALPEALLRARYDATRWRFVAPEAFRVDDLRLLCCGDPRACAEPALEGCFDGARDAMQRLRAALPSPATPADLEVAAARVAIETPEVTAQRYVFFHAADGRQVDRRLRQVDRAVAEAVAALEPGELTEPLRSAFGYHVMRLDRRRPAIDLAWADPRTQALLRAELCPIHLAGQVDRLRADLLAALPVSLDEGAIARARDRLTGAE